VIPGYHLNKFVTGLYQASEVRDDLDEPWLAGAMTIVIVLALMIVAYFIPRGRRPRAMAERDWRSVSSPSAICGLNPGDWI
jgi:hypothetical protein